MPKSLVSETHPSPDAGRRSLGLHPKLQAALIGLDVDLDRELVRYRRQRLVQRTPVSRPARPASAVATAPAIASSVPSLRATPTAPSTAYGVPLPDVWEMETPSSAIAPSPIPQTFSTAAHEPATREPLTHEPSAHESSVPDDYLASSEALLRSLSDPLPSPTTPTPPKKPEEPGLMATLLTPLGVGSMLLLLLSSATLGYVLTNPSVVGLPSLAQLWGGETAAPTTPTVSADPEGIANPDLAAEEFVELDLDTLSTLPRSGTPGDRTSQQNPNAIALQPSSNPGTTSPNGAPATPTIITRLQPPEFGSTTPEPTTPVVEEAAAPAETMAADPAPTEAPEFIPQEADPLPSVASAPMPYVEDPAPVQVPVASAPAADATNYYYVVADYSGDQSLGEAQGVVGDAYVRNFPDAGAQVQFGAFTDPARAEALLRELESRGISAEIYQPE